MRDPVRTFVACGPLPHSNDVDADVELRPRQLEAIASRVTMEEARALVTCFNDDGEDDCFGLAWTLLHTIESVAIRLFDREPEPNANAWVRYMWEREERGR